MRAKTLVDGLALAGALIALAGVVLAANSALADEVQVTDSIGKKAATEAAEEAIEALRQKTRVDLDIRLPDLKSTLIAGNR
jgi:phage tail protein X